MSDGTTTWRNTYNSDGLRTSRTDGTTTYTYYYEEGRLSAIKRNDLDMWIIYDENGPVTLKYGVGTFHYVTNLQGDVVAIVGNQGQTLVEYTYDAWGKVTSITGDYAYNLGIHNPILYRGYVYDHETGLYYCQSRYYDPQTHRFLNADAFAATGQGLLGNNMFAYCGNDPVNCCDPSGYFGLAALVGAVVNVTTTFIAAKVTGQDYTWTDAAVAALSGAANAIPGVGPLISGAITATYTAYMSYQNGASFGESLICGVFAGVCTTASISNLANFQGPALDLVTTAVVDFVFGTGYNSMAAATYKAVTDNGNSQASNLIIASCVSSGGGSFRSIIGTSSQFRMSYVQ